MTDRPTRHWTTKLTRYEAESAHFDVLDETGKPVGKIIHDRQPYSDGTSSCWHVTATHYETAERVELDTVTNSEWDLAAACERIFPRIYGALEGMRARYDKVEVKFGKPVATDFDGLSDAERKAARSIMERVEGLHERSNRISYRSFSVDLGGRHSAGSILELRSGIKRWYVGVPGNMDPFGGVLSCLDPTEADKALATRLYGFTAYAYGKGALRTAKCLAAMYINP